MELQLSGRAFPRTWPGRSMRKCMDMSPRTSILTFLLTLFLLFPVCAIADDVAPSTYSTSLLPGQSVTITKTVTISQGPPTTAKIDVFFLADSTGSMGGLIDGVKTNVTTILANTSGLGDVAYGVGEYRDVGDIFVYRLNQDITKDLSLVNAGINLWFADGGGDWEEAALYALTQMANGAAWRPGSTRLALWFGDAPSHDPDGPTPGVTLSQAIAALQAQLIKVEALDLSGLNSYGQAQAIADATGGQYYSSVDVTQIVNEIKNAITTIFQTYGTVSLGTAEVPSGLSVSISPPAYTGEYDRTIDRTFTFQVTFTASRPGTYRFHIPVLVDGGTMAIETDNINVIGNRANITPIIELLLKPSGYFE
jgi:hypothetical protein